MSDPRVDWFKAEVESAKPLLKQDPIFCLNELRRSQGKEARIVAWMCVLLKSLEGKTVEAVEFEFIDSEESSDTTWVALNIKTK